VRFSVFSDATALVCCGSAAFLDPMVACVVFVLLISKPPFSISLDSQRGEASSLPRDGRGLGLKV